MLRFLGALVVIAWLVIGGLAAGQRGYFENNKDTDCATLSTIAVTVIAGPLNYIEGVNPKVDCKADVPEPSSS